MAMKCSQLSRLLFCLFFSNFLAANIELRSVFKQTVVDTVPESAYSGELLLLSSL